MRWIRCLTVASLSTDHCLPIVTACTERANHDKPPLANHFPADLYDPQASGCTGVSTPAYLFLNGSHAIRIELRYSSTCNAYWARFKKDGFDCCVWATLREEQQKCTGWA